MNKININDIIYIIGSAKDIAATYRSMCKAYENGDSHLKPKFLKPPKFAEWRRIYCLYINNGEFAIINSDLMLSILIENGKI